jgi:hypothetical protein
MAGFEMSRLQLSEGRANALTIGIGDDKVDVVLTDVTPPDIEERIRKRFEQKGGTAAELALWMQGCNWGLTMRKKTLSLGV